MPGVRAWGERVGAVARDPRLGYYAFQYAPAWKRSGIEFSPLTIPLNGPDIVIFPDLPELTFYRLPGLLADALPDAFGNALIDAWMARKATCPRLGAWLWDSKRRAPRRIVREKCAKAQYCPLRITSCLRVH